MLLDDMEYCMDVINTNSKYRLNRIAISVVKKAK